MTAFWSEYIGDACIKTGWEIGLIRPVRSKPTNVLQYLLWPYLTDVIMRPQYTRTMYLITGITFYLIAFCDKFWTCASFHITGAAVWKGISATRTLLKGAKRASSVNGLNNVYTKRGDFHQALKDFFSVQPTRIEHTQVRMLTFHYITKTYQNIFDTLKPHFYIVKLGFTWVYIIFLISVQKHRLWVLVRTASARWF